jgi:hypothetical protein
MYLPRCILDAFIFLTQAFAALCLTVFLIALLPPDEPNYCRIAVAAPLVLLGVATPYVVSRILSW